jgi:hypothetical protein
LATLCVTFSLALFALGGTDPTGGFCLQSLIFSRPTTIMGLVLDMVAVSRTIDVMICEERGRGGGEGACKRIQCPLLHSAKAHGLTASALTQWGSENNRLPLHTPASSRISSCHLPVILLMPKEREREKRKGKKSKRERDRDRTSFVVLYSMCWGRSRR